MNVENTTTNPKPFWGSDGVHRTAQEHYCYLVECARLWKEQPNSDVQAFSVRLRALDFFRKHCNEFMGAVPSL